MHNLYRQSIDEERIRRRSESVIQLKSSTTDIETDLEETLGNEMIVGIPFKSDTKDDGEDDDSVEFSDSTDL